MDTAIPVILDGDPGHDDAIAWTAAAVEPGIRVLAVTSVAGNQTIEKTTLNAARILTLTGLHVPLAKGAGRPLVSPPMTAPSVHGETGLDGPALPDPVVPVLDMPAVELIARVLRDHPAPVTIMATGPLTNVATLLLLHPELKQKIAAVYFMGGGIRFGNWTAAAEFNILVDPEAAEIVFNAGVPLFMCGLDVTERALILPPEFDELAALGSKVAAIAAGWLRFFYSFHKEKGYAGAPVHDAVALAAIVRPDILSFREMAVQVERTGDYCRGATVGDWYGLHGKPKNMQVSLEIDRDAFVRWLFERIARYGEVST